MSRVIARLLRASFLVVLVAVAGLPATAAQADDTTAAWSVAPSDAAGVPTASTRFELEVDPGGSVEEHAVLTNSSTVEREFTVYGADAFNTPTGGYDLAPAATQATDAGSWVRIETPIVTIPALSTATIAFSVDVPDGATPGDHPGGLVVSPVRSETTDAGVVVDTRVAVRLNVRVAGEIAANLTVKNVGVAYGATLVPYGRAPATVTYEVTNTGNVKVVGVPRLRVTGPFGIGLGKVEEEQTHEVLPGDSFTVTTVLPAVAPLVVDTVTVDVDMAAAPGPATDLPLVSSTARATFFAVPWTGFLLLALVALGTWAGVRSVRRRRWESSQAWDDVVEQARRDVAEGRQPQAPTEPTVVQQAAGARAPGAGTALALGLLVAAGLAVGNADTAHADEPDTGTLSLSVPAATSGSGGSSSGSGVGTGTGDIPVDPPVDGAVGTPTDADPSS